MNILFSCDEYPPLCTGGIGTATKTVAENLAQKGHTVVVVSGWIPDHNLPYVSKVNNVIVYRIKYFKHLKSILTSNNIVNRLLRFILSKSKILALLAQKEWKKNNSFIAELIKKHNIEIIEFPDYNILTKYITDKIILKYPHWNIPIVGRIHGNEAFLSYYRKGHINKKTLKNDYNFFHSCNAILSVSKFAANFVQQTLNIRKKIDIIYNPMNEDFIIDPLDLKKIRKKEIIFIGKLTETKGAFNLIKAFNIFSKQYPEYTLVMIGGGNIDKARAYIDKEVVSRVFFTGFINNRQILEYLDRAAFAVIPTFFETLGQAAIEILGRGNILIYTNTATGTEIIKDNDNGFLVNPYNINEIVEKMIYVADNIDKLCPMRYQAIHSVKQKFSENIIISQLEQYYTRIINEYTQKN